MRRIFAMMKSLLIECALAMVCVFVEGFGVVLEVFVGGGSMDGGSVGGGGSGGWSPACGVTCLEV